MNYDKKKKSVWRWKDWTKWLTTLFYLILTFASKLANDVIIASLAYRHLREKKLWKNRRCLVNHYLLLMEEGNFGGRSGSFSWKYAELSLENADGLVKIFQGCEELLKPGENRLSLLLLWHQNERESAERTIWACYSALKILLSMVSCEDIPTNIHKPNRSRWFCACLKSWELKG